jgi:proline dehydrogenase
MASASVEPNLSIKLTQFGLDVDAVTCYRNVEHLVEAAAARKGFIRIDMESSAYTDRTLALVDDLFTRFGNVGAAIQAYLFRSEQDVEALCQRGIRVRLCKGAYLEPPDIAWEKKGDVDANFVKLMKRLLLDGTYPAIATHDERIIHAARKFVAENKIPASDFEFQMLYGIRRDLQRLLVAQGYRVRVYVPYGRAWYPYFMRRLAERPANALFLAKNLFR